MYKIYFGHKSTSRKSAIFILISIILIIGIVLADDHSTTIYTPRYSVVPDTYIMDEHPQWYINFLNNFYDEEYPNATRTGSASRKYNCHGWAWHVSEGGNQVWIGYSSKTAEDIYWQDGSYCQVSTQYSTKVSYQSNHSANRITNNLFESKWGDAPRYKHAPSDCPYTLGSATYRLYRPNGPTLTMTNYGQIGHSPELDWNALSGANSYDVWRKPDYPPWQNWEKLTTTTNTEYTDWDVMITAEGEGDNEYFYYVDANYDWGSSHGSNTVATWGDSFQKRNVNADNLILPKIYALQQNNPNPFNPVTTIFYQIPENTHVKIEIYDLRGRLIKNLVDKEHVAGYYSIRWDANNYPSGTYIYRIITYDFKTSKIMTLVK